MNRPDPQELGTRYDHYVELRDLFAQGVEIIKGMRETWKSVGERTQQQQLESAVMLINKRLDLITGYDDGCYKLGRIIDALPVLHPKLLTEGDHGPNIDKCSPSQNQ